MTKRARELLQRGYQLWIAQLRYGFLLDPLELFIDVLGNSALGRKVVGQKVNRRLLTRMRQVLKADIYPQQQAVAHVYAALFGFSLGDSVCVQNQGEAPVRLQATRVHFSDKDASCAWLSGPALKADGKPGRKGAHATLAPGLTKVTVLSSRQGRLSSRCT